MNLAIVHDFLNQFGGAERVVSALHELFPAAPVFTSIYDQSRLPASFGRLDIRTSFMQNLPFVSQFHRWYFLFYPLAFERFDLAGYDVILSSSSAFAKGVKKQNSQLHICYCHTPMRFVWRYDDYVKRESLPDWLKWFLPFLLEPLKNWDRQNSKNVDLFIANSRTVAERIKKIYGRDSVIINPPVDTERFVPVEVDHDYYLIVSRLNAYKRIDLVVEAFNRLDLPLRIIGDGPESKKLKNLAKANITFLGRLPDDQVAKQLAECRALVFPGEEDFGIAPLEAMACGRPVIAYRSGGAAETVQEGISGIFFDKQDVASLVQALKKGQFEMFDKKAIRQRALAFSKEIFKSKIAKLVNEQYEKRTKRL